MQKVNTPQGPVWMNITAARETLNGTKPRPSLLGVKQHASNPESTTSRYEAAVNFYKGGSVANNSSEPAPGSSTPPPTTLSAPKKPQIEIDVTKFVPYNGEDSPPKPERKSKSIEVGTIYKEGWNLWGGGKKKEEAKEETEEKKEIKQQQMPEINTEGIADVLQEVKEKKEQLKGEEVNTIQEAENTMALKPEPMKELNDAELMETIYGRLLKLKQVEAELEDMRKRCREAELTSEQLVIKLGKEKEQVEELKGQMKNLTQHNTQLVSALEKQNKMIEKLQHTQQQQQQQQQKTTTPTKPSRLW